jgi:hypothetical protein
LTYDTIEEFVPSKQTVLSVRPPDAQLANDSNPSTRGLSLFAKDEKFEIGGVRCAEATAVTAAGRGEHRIEASRGSVTIFADIKRTARTTPSLV